MKSERWQKVKQIFEDAIEIESSLRPAFVEEACSGDASLRVEVQRLIDSFDDAGSFMERPPSSEVASLIVERRDMLASGQKFSRYDIVARVGAGGMGEVYLANDSKLNRKVAIKILNRELNANETNLARFLREAQSASSLSHPNILIIHEIGDENNSKFIVSEYVEGKTLREAMNDRRLNLTEVLNIGAQIAGALAAAHGANLVHRDIKPDNIIVRPDGYIKVLDFGLAKLVREKSAGLDDKAIGENQTAKGIIMGTVNYMSPEQARGDHVDQRSDIFSLGSVIYEMVTGTIPFRGDSMSDTFANLINMQQKPLSQRVNGIPDELDRIVAKMLRKKTVERYQTMKEAFDDLTKLKRRLEFEQEFGTQLDQRSGETNTAILETPKTGRPNSIAVLPFANVGGDPENEYFCDGLTEELINSLAKIRDLRVAGRTSAFSFKGKDAAASEIGSTLNVARILEGSVRRSGDHVRIAIQLIDTSNGFQLWSERYDADLKDIFALQDRITLSVINELRVKLLSGEKQAIEHRYSDNVEAYQLYLKGRYHFLKLTPPETLKGISYLEEAIKLEPNYALAYAGLTAAYVTLPLTSDGLPSEFFPKAKVAAARALAIDDQVSETYAALFWATLWFDWDWDAAERQCFRAIDLDPQKGDGFEALAHLYSIVGRHSEALENIKRAREFDPLHLRINALEGQFLAHAGRSDEALERLEKTLELEPRFWLGHLFSSSAYTSKGMYDEAIESAVKAREFSGSSHPTAFLGYALAKSGKEAEARRELKVLADRAAIGYVPAPHFAMIHLGLGEIDEALRWLEKGLEDRDSRMAFLKTEPKWDSLRSEPRFQALITKLGFEADQI
jgi:serine/threonine protein kinase